MHCSKFIKDELCQLKYSNPTLVFTRKIVPTGTASLTIKTSACGWWFFFMRAVDFGLFIRCPTIASGASQKFDVQGVSSTGILDKVLTFAVPK